jgi:hypothetical protein
MADPAPGAPSPPIRLGNRRWPRVRAAPGTRVRPGQGAPDPGAAVLDLSEGGIRLLLSAPLPKGQDFEVALEAPGGGPPVTVRAEVVWSVPTADGRCCVGARLRAPLSPRDLQALAGP